MYNYITKFEATVAFTRCLLKVVILKLGIAPHKSLLMIAMPKSLVVKAFKKDTYLKSSFISLNHLSSRGPSRPAAVRALWPETIFGSLGSPPTVFEPSSLLLLLLGYDLFTLNSTGEKNKRIVNIHVVEHTATNLISTVNPAFTTAPKFETKKLNLSKLCYAKCHTRKKTLL